VRLAEIAGGSAELAPGAETCRSYRRRPHRFVPVADVHVAIGRDRDVVRLVQMRVVFAVFARSADGQQNFPGQSELADRVGSCVGGPQVAGAVEANRMGILKEAVLSLVLHQLAVRRVDLHGDFSAVESPHIAVGSNGDAGHGSVPFTAGRLFLGPDRIELG
jgi:hypothetical protein